MVLSLLVTGVMPAVFADGEDIAAAEAPAVFSAPESVGEPAPDPAPSYEEVAQSFDNAEKQAEQAGAVAAAEGEATVVIEEALAVINEQLTETHVEIAEAIDENAQEELTELAEDAKEQQDAAEEAAEKAEKDADRAEFDAAGASFMEDVSENAAKAAGKNESLDEAKKAWEIADHAADAADSFADDAARAAHDAVINADKAKANAEQAQKDYEDAKQLYDETVADVERQLALGLIDAEIAKNLTEAAKKEADEKLADAEQARKDAEQANSDQAAAVEGARKVLEDELAVLDDIIKDNATEVAKDAALAAATGLAAEAAELAVKAADRVVDSYQEDIDELTEQIGALDEQLKVFDDAIKEAEDKLDELKAQKKEEVKNKYGDIAAALYNPDSYYQDAVDELEALKKAKDEAQKIKDHADNIRAEKAKTELYSKMGTIQANIRDSKNPTQSDVNELTKIVFENLPNFGVYSDVLKNVEPVEGEEGIFKAIDKDGQEVFFKAELAGNRYKRIVQYYLAEQLDGKKLSGSSGLTNYINNNNITDGQEVSKLAATSGSDTVYPVKAIANAGGNVELNVLVEQPDGSVKAYPIQYSALGYYYQPGTKLTDRQYISLTDLEGKTYITAKELDLDSNAIKNILDQFGNDEGVSNLQQKTSDLEKAQTAFNQEWGDYKTLKDTIAQQKALRDAKEAELGISGLRAELENLDKKLNGGLGDRVLTALIRTNGPEIVKMVTEENLDFEAFSSLILNNISTILAELRGESAASIIGATKDGWNQAETIIGALNTLTDKEINLKDDISAIVELISGASMSPQMRLAVAETIEGLAKAEFEKAQDTLAEAIKTAEEEISAQGEKVAAATADFAREELVYLGTQAKLAEAKMVEVSAEKLQKEAAEAAEAAQEAFEKLEELKKDPVDDSKVKEAEAAYQAAKEAAEKADAEAKKALGEARVARIKAIKAARNADYAEAVYKILLSYCQKFSVTKDSPDIDFDALRAVNPDIIAWITVPGTNIDYPVVQGKDNEYYVNHLFEGDENDAGCIFMDVACKPDFSGVNSVLYGNNFDGIMFSELVKYLDPAFLSANSKALIITPDNEFTVEFTGAKTLALGDNSFAEQSEAGRTLTLATFTDDGAERVIVTGTIK